MTNFHFFHYKSVETLSCQSNENTRATSTRNVNFVEAANVMSISAKFQLQPLMASEEMIFENLLQF